MGPIFDARGEKRGEGRFILIPNSIWPGLGDMGGEGGRGRNAALRGGEKEALSLGRRREKRGEANFLRNSAAYFGAVEATFANARMGRYWQFHQIPIPDNRDAIRPLGDPPQKKQCFGTVSQFATTFAILLLFT